MGLFFAKKIEDPEEAYSRLISVDPKASTAALEEFQNNLDSKLTLLLCQKFILDETTLDIRLKILKVFAAKTSVFNNMDIKEILKLTKIQGPKYREAFKDVFGRLDENHLSPLEEHMEHTTDPEIHIILQSAIEATGIVDKHLTKWKTYPLAEKLLHLEKMVRVQSTKLYPILFEILQDEARKTDEKKALQSKLSSLLEIIKDPAFLELAIRKMPNIDPITWSPLFRCLQQQGEAFFKSLFTGFAERGEVFKYKAIQVIQELTNPLAFNYLFPSLFDKSKRVPDAAQKAIEEIIKKVVGEFEVLPPEEKRKPETLEKLTPYAEKIIEFISQPKIKPFAFLGECLLRLGQLNEEICFKAFPKIWELSQASLISFIRTKDVTERKAFLIRAARFPLVETGRTVLIFIQALKSEDFAVNSLDELIQSHVRALPEGLLNDLIQCAFAIRPKNVIENAIHIADPDSKVKIIEGIALSGIPDILPIVLKLKSDPDPKVRGAIFKALSSSALPPETSNQILTHFLGDPNPDIVLETIATLRDGDHQGSLLVLNKLLVTTRDEKIKRATAEAVSLITKKKLFKSFDQINDQTKRAILGSLLRIDPGFIEEMFADLSAPEVEKRKLAAKILNLIWAQIPDEKRLPVEEGIRNPDPFVRAVFTKLSVVYSPQTAKEILAETLSDEDPRVRANTIEAIGMLKDEDLLTKVNLLVNDSHHRIRANALVLLWKFGSQRPDSAIYEMLKGNKSTQIAAIYACSEFKEQRFLQLILPYLRNPDPYLRKIAIRHLAKFPPTLNPIDHIKNLKNDPDEGVKQLVAVIMLAKPK
ncbi:MAG: HEAT repeat domain-containing protein [Candidatus Riflebacteria bacterium]|nr:HEAT repeat domain-containing protein [Candidatus Riflebacteria bacterium]